MPSSIAKRGTNVSVAVSIEEAEWIQMLARKRGVTVSSLLRAMVGIATECFTMEPSADRLSQSITDMDISRMRRSLEVITNSSSGPDHNRSHNRGRSHDRDHNRDRDHQVDGSSGDSSDDHDRNHDHDSPNPLGAPPPWQRIGVDAL